jgi:endoglucanase
MGLDLDLLKRLCETPGIAGREERVAAVAREALAALADDVQVDALGNVIARKAGRGGPRVMLAAHLDEIGFMVRHIDDQGFLRLQPVGGFDPRVLPAQRVRVWTRDGKGLIGALQLSTKPIHLLQSSELKPPRIDEFYVDLGLRPEEVRARVEVGDMVTLDRPLEVTGQRVLSKALDDRAGVFVMIEALRALGAHEAEVVAVATTQEEVGLRGAQTSAFGVEPDVGIALDITIAGDVPGIDPHEQVTKLGEGVAIKVFDTSHIPNHRLVRHLREVAEQHEIRYQLEVLPRGGTDAGAIQRVRAGVPAVTVSIPTRHVHTVNEMADLADIEAAVLLIARYLEVAHTGDYRPR